MSEISDSFKGIVLDLRVYLEKVQEVFSKKNKLVSDNEIRKYFPKFKEKMDQIYGRFISCVKDLSAAEHNIYKSYFSKNLSQLFLASPFIRHSTQKPYGYSGDYEMVLKVLDKEIEGGAD